MEKLFIYLLVISAASLMIVTALENNDTNLNNTTLNNTTLTNTTSNIVPNSTNNSSINASDKLSTPQFVPTNESVFMISSIERNRSAFEIGTPTRPTRNASGLWYLIQAKPHGYV